MNVRLPLALAACAVALSLSLVHGQARRSGAPKLIVILVVDQMRTDYIERFGAAFTAGLKRLRDEGTWFQRGAYPYLKTVTCAGHSTIGTGALPYHHGMILNRWWDRAAGEARDCTDDHSVKNIGYLAESTNGDSAAPIRVPTFAEQVRKTTGGQSFVVSLKPRSAISLAGKGPSVVLWQERTNWVTSPAFTAAPIEWVKEYVSANPVTADRGKTWERMLPLSAYSGDDDAKGERFPTGWTAVFPHPIGVPENQFEAQWQRSPLADEYLARFAIHAVDTMKLGHGSGTDVLGVSFSTLDLVGHQFGPQSHEVQDIVFRLDATIGRLLEGLDSRFGKDGYVLALSADHGVSDLTERTGGSRHLSAEITATVTKALEPILGAGKPVAHVEYTDIYFAAGVADKVWADPKAWSAVRDALLALPGIARVMRASELGTAAARSSNDPVIRAAALSHFPARSGDIIIVPKENWLFSSSAATHGTLYTYDQRVPVMFFGAGVPAARRDEPATPADITPTLAALAGIRFDAPDGRALLWPTSTRK